MILSSYSIAEGCVATQPSKELAALDDELLSIHDYRRISEIADLGFAKTPHYSSNNVRTLVHGRLAHTRDVVRIDRSAAVTPVIFVYDAPGISSGTANDRTTGIITRVPLTFDPGTASSSFSFEPGLCVITSQNVSHGLVPKSICQIASHLHGLIHTLIVSGICMSRSSLSPTATSLR